MTETEECAGCGETRALQDNVCGRSRDCDECPKFPMEYVHANGTPWCDTKRQFIAFTSDTIRKEEDAER